FELGMCLGKSGAPLGWRWVEHGRYLRGQTPLEKGFLALRKEAEKLTIYQLELPLAYLGLKAEAGQKFGFSFLVNDQDEGAGVEKSIAASPGMLRPPYPGKFAQGVLEK